MDRGDVTDDRNRAPFLTLASWITYSRLWPKCDGHVDRDRFRTLRETPIRIRVAILSYFDLD